MPTPFPAFIIIQHISEWNQSINLRYTWNKHQVEGYTFIIAATGACILMNFISSEVLTDLRERLHYSTIADKHVSQHLLYLRYYNLLLLCMNSKIVFTSSTNAPEGVTSQLCLIFRLFKHCKCFSQPALSDYKVCTVSDNCWPYSCWTPICLIAIKAFTVQKLWVPASLEPLNRPKICRSLGRMW